MKTNVADTSIDAYYALGPRLGQQQRAIIAFLGIHCHRDFTRSEIADATGLRLSSVCARCNELRKLQIIEELPRRPCRTTGVQAHPVKLAAGQLELGLGSIAADAGRAAHSLNYSPRMRRSLPRAQGRAMTWPQPIADYWRDPYAYLAAVLPAPHIPVKRGPKMDPDARRARERERMRQVRARARGDM